MGLSQSAARGELQSVQAPSRGNVGHVKERHGVNRVFEPQEVHSVRPLLPYPPHLFPSWTIGLIQAGGFGRDEDVYCEDLHKNVSKQRGGYSEALIGRRDEGSSRGTINKNRLKEEERHIKYGGFSSRMAHRNHLKAERPLQYGTFSRFLALWSANYLRLFQRSSKQSENDDVEEELMLQRAIEDSIVDRIRLDCTVYEDDLGQAIAESMKTAGIKKEIDLKKAYGEIVEDEIWFVGSSNKNYGTNRNGSTSQSFGRNYMEQSSDNTQENMVLIPPLSESGLYSSEPRNDYLGGLSTEEQQDAIMLEAAMLGSLPEDFTLKFGYLYEQHVRPTPSPTITAERQLREQQDMEYLASLEADRKKEAKARIDEEARRLKEAENRAAAEAEEQHRQQEALLKRLVDEEFERQMVAKKALLPPEPSVDDEGVIKLMVRMPDGSKQSRRFHGSNPLQRLYDFIDITCRLVPGSYKLVRPYPRRGFCAEEQILSFHDLGLRSKSEALFLEFVE